jgi:hypothetical protein
MKGDHWELVRTLLTFLTAIAAVGGLAAATGMLGFALANLE